MTTPYTGTATWVDVPLPDDGDDADASIFDPPHEVLADRTAYLRTMAIYEKATLDDVISSSSSHTYVDSAATVSLAGRAVGDKVRISVCLRLNTDDTTGVDRAYARLVCTENGGSAIVLALERIAPAIGSGAQYLVEFAGTIVRTIATAGTFVAKVQIKAEGTHNAILAGNGQLIAQLT